jgi:hypothetical protein
MCTGILFSLNDDDLCVCDYPKTIFDPEVVATCICNDAENYFAVGDGDDCAICYGVGSEFGFKIFFYKIGFKIILKQSLTIFRY